MNLFVGPALLLGLVLIELFVLGVVRKEKLPWNEIIMNLNSGHILLWVFRGLELLGFYYIETYFSFGIVAQWPLALQVAFTFVAWDFLFYWLHRLHHTWKFLWAIHEVHHQGEHFNLSLGIRNSWYSSLTSLPFFIPLALLGVPTEVFLLVSSIHYFVQFYNHNKLVVNSGILEYFMVTPALHKVHHGKNEVYRDKNCGGTLNIWDRLFGTYQRELKNEPIQFGIDEPIRSENPFWVNTVPFLKIAGRNVKSQNRPPFELSKIWVSVGGLLLFLPLLLYIKQESSLDLIAKVLFFSSVFISTLALGGLYEGKYWGLFGWIVINVVLNSVLLYSFLSPQIWNYLALGLLFLHAVITPFLIKK
ncbi:sterol desaturase family protein [bacterium]|nr:sterol desaturase family protein [bacterium]